LSILINKVSFQIAENIGELTTWQYMEMNRHRDNLNIVRLLSVLTGIDYDVLQNANCEEFYPIVSLLNFNADESPLSELKIKESITIGGKECQIKTNIEAETFGQKVFAQEYLNQAADEKIDRIEALVNIAA